VEPDYEYLINLFKKLGQRHGIEYDNQFDWCKEEEVIV
jgi:casein kinase 1